ncbi:MAG: DNA repair protein RecN [Myxococcales bacterium]|nr:MAG: DNA repair protein RecN [Myxococcales bacterium]
MLRQLAIRNFAIIESLDLDFSPGLTVLTGETGAGKSILVGALALVLGGRASADLLRTGSEEAEVAARFDWPDDADLRTRLDELGVPAGDELMLRRQVQREGKSRAWVNDRPITVGVLAQLAGRLVDISSQHQHQSLLNVENHRLLLDRAGGLEAQVADVGLRYAALMELVRKRRRLAEAQGQRAEREAFLRFQIDEIEKAGVQPGEEKALQEQRQTLRHAEQIKAALDEALTVLDGQPSAGALAIKAERALNQAAQHLPSVGDLARRLESARIEIEDVAESVRSLGDKLDADPGRLEEIEDRLALLSRLLKKHGPTTEELLAKTERMRGELAEMEDVEGALADLDKKLKAAESSALAAAEDLSGRRRDAALALGKKVEAELASLGMRKTAFQVSVRPRSGSEETVSAGGRALGPQGLDEVEFLIAPNVGETPRPLARIASGGELSRVMLAIKGVLLASDPVDVSIFDEVDAGIGGAVAQMVGKKIHGLARARQVICITHLPQIAAYADQHSRVEKEARKGRTYTRVATLDEREERVREVARLMAGEAAGEASLEAARELLAHSRGG